MGIALSIPDLAVHDGRPEADSRDVATTFGKQHKHVLEAIRDCHCSAEFRRSNFRPFTIKDLTGERTSHVMMTKNGFAFLVLGFTGAAAGVFKEAYIERFDAMEEQLRAARGAALPQSFAEALRLAADQQEQIERRDAALAIAGPKAAAHDRIASLEGLTCLTDGAKQLGIPPRTFTLELVRRRWLYRRADGNLVPFQDKDDANLMKLKTVEDRYRPDRFWPQAFLTAKGLTKLAVELESDPVPAREVRHG